MILYGFNSRNKIKKKEKEKVWEVEQKKKTWSKYRVV